MEGLPIHHDIEQEASGLIGCVSLAAELGASVEVIPVSEIKPIIIELLMRCNGLKALYQEALTTAEVAKLNHNHEILEELNGEYQDGWGEVIDKAERAIKKAHE